MLITNSDQAHILVCSLQLDGRGDVHGAHEIALRVQKLMPEAKVSFTILQPRFSPVETLLFSDRDFVDAKKIEQEEGWEVLKEAEALRKIESFRAVLIYPTYHDSLLPTEILTCKNPVVIKFRENSCPNRNPGLIDGPTYTLGLNSAEGEKGVLVPMKLSCTAPPSRPPTSVERLAHLKDVAPELSKAILGKNFSPEATLEFSKTSKLFIGYFSQPNYFTCFVNALIRCKSGNLVIFNTQKRSEELVRDIHKPLWQAGFGKVCIIEFTSPTQTKVEAMRFKTKQPRDKTCTIIFRGLKTEEMEAMLEATEDECLVTGDLSPYRFLAHRKTFSYDTRNQKEEAALSMIALASKFDPRFQTLLTPAFFGASEPGEEVDVNIVERGMINLFYALDKDPKLKEAWNQFVDEVFTKHDFTPQLEAILKERLTRSDENPTGGLLQNSLGDGI